MKLLARLMSHGFSIALVVLLAIGFIYRGELFPEWELPGFLAIDSGGKKEETTLVGKPESAPVQDDWMTSEPVATDQVAQESLDVEDMSTGMVPAEAATGDEPVVAPAQEAETASEVVAPVAAAVMAGVTGESHAPATAEDAVVVDASQGPVAGGTSASIPADEAGATAEPVVNESAGDQVDTAATPEAGDAGTGMPQASEAADMMHSPEVSIAGETAQHEPAGAVVDVRTGDQIDAVVTSRAADEGAADAGVASEAVPGMAAAGNAGMPIPAESEDSVPAPLDIADSSVSAYRLLAAAREAYWLHDYQAAEENYRTMILNDPGNPDGYGELANMYFSQGNWEAASAAYYEAGSRLVKSGLLAPASDLIDVIRGLNGSQADALEREIESARAESR